VGRLVQLCGDDCHGRVVALRRLHLLAASRCLLVVCGTLSGLQPAVQSAREVLQLFTF
jgi:hypothetical protein